MSIIHLTFQCSSLRLYLNAYIMMSYYLNDWNVDRGLRPWWIFVLYFVLLKGFFRCYSIMLKSSCTCKPKFHLYMVDEVVVLCSLCCSVPGYRHEADPALQPGQSLRDPEAALHRLPGRPRQPGDHTPSWKPRPLLPTSMHIFIFICVVSPLVFIATTDSSCVFCRRLFFRASWRCRAMSS